MAHEYLRCYSDLVSQRNLIEQMRAELGRNPTSLPHDLLKANFGAGDYLAFLGRLSPEKGAHVAIKWARSAGLPLRIAQRYLRVRVEFFKEQIEPFLDGRQVEFVGSH